MHRKESTTASGSHTAPAGCNNGTFDHTLQFSGLPGNCAGIFTGWPKCSAFYPSDETPAGKRFWAMKKPALEKPLSLQSRIPTLDEAFKSNVTFSDSVVASALDRVRTEGKQMLAGLQR